MNKINHVFSSPDTETSEKETLNIFLENFNPIKKKYSVISDELPPDVISTLCEYEDMNQFGDLVKQKYSSIIDNLKLVYGDPRLITKDIRTYHLVEKSVIHQYLAIPQLDKMFDEDYFNFEWDMHVGQNFREHRNDYYRDHFLHQIRNLYMMDVLLCDFSFFGATRKILEDKSKSKISLYVSKKLQQFLWDKHSKHFQLFDCVVQGLHPAISSESYAEEYFYNYIIYASSYLSALFHDMGYPVCHFLEVRHRLSDYSPGLYMFTHNAVESFDQLASKLGDSLLFTIVDLHEIKSRLQINKKGKYDHGAYSAIAFLLHFYESGVIYGLTQEKQCAIELAAVAIYNHTSKYNCIEYSKENNYYKPYFDLNPISFLLRLCDDLQEWDRRYFEITDDSDLMICPKCSSPMLPQVYKSKKTKYMCRCKNSEKKAPIRHESFLKRKVYVVRTADTLVAERINEGNNKILKLFINYDLYKLLKMSRVNNTYAKYRLKELNEIKKLLESQNFRRQSGYDDCFDAIYIDYFITANPITIKTKIIEKYVKSHIKEDEWTKLSVYDISGKIIALLKRSGLRNSSQFFQSVITYVTILKNALDYKKERSDKNLNIYVNNIISSIKFSSEYDGLYKEIIYTLIKDCVLQYGKEKRDDETYMSTISSDNYYTQYTELHSNIYDCISKYCCIDNDFNKYKSDVPINYYSDLYLFDHINRFGF